MKKFLFLLIGICLLISCEDKESKVVNDSLKSERINLINSIDSLKKIKANTIAFNDSLKELNEFMRSNQESRERNDKLINERNVLESVNFQLENEHKALRAKVKKNIFALNASENVYIIKIKIHQTTYTLSISEHIKNKINDVEFELPVDKGYYDKCSVGQLVTDSKFKMGSLLRDGDFSKLKIIVTGKRIIKRT